MALRGESSSSSDSFEYHSCIRGYHEYKSIWDASIGEVVNCSREPDNVHDDNAVSVVRRGIIVGHVPRYLSRGFSLFLEMGGSISATVVSTRRYSRDLPQGGLEIPCQYLLQGPTEETKNIRKFLTACEDNYKMIKLTVSRSAEGEANTVKQEVDTPASCKCATQEENPERSTKGIVMYLYCIVAIVL